jgi:hypothetical protein
MDCPDGSRSLGWYDGDESLAVTMAAKTGVSVEVADRIIAHTPKLEGVIERVTVGTRDCPDVLISYAQPETSMKLLRERRASCGAMMPPWSPQGTAFPERPVPMRRCLPLKIVCVMQRETVREIDSTKNSGMPETQ